MFHSVFTKGSTLLGSPGWSAVINFGILRDPFNFQFLRGAVQKNFLQNLGFWPNEGGGGLAQSQVF